jgi:hypothetical protein
LSGRRQLAENKMRKVSRLLPYAAALSLLLAGSALAGGGKYLDGDPEIPLGQRSYYTVRAAATAESGGRSWAAAPTVETPEVDDSVKMSGRSLPARLVRAYVRLARIFAL